MKKLKCLRCGHEWVKRKDDVRVCPKCHSAWWNQRRDTDEDLHEVQNPEMP